MKKKQAGKTGPPVFRKEALLRSERYRGRRDLIAALLAEEREYALEEVGRELEGFLKRKER